jgi:alkaline phosphatase D
MTEIDRRTLLRNAAAGSVLVAFGGFKALDRSSPIEPSLPANPFTLGVASGDPLPDAVVLWTRLAPEPLTASGGLDGVGNVRVGWELAEDAAMQRVVRRGGSVAAADLAHAVHVDARGLRPGREYWYRFTVGDWATEPARTRTAPAAHDAVDAVRFAFCTCQKWEDGFYNAFAHLAEEDLDLVLHLGDYTYEYGIDPATGGVRGVTLPAEYAKETVTLDQFRLRHALYKTDSDLQRAHARFPWVTVWDDHEIDNDYTADIPEDGTPPEEFRLRRIAGYQAFYEHLPLRSVARPDRRGNAELYRAITWGPMAEFDVVDTRQYRDDHPCGDGERARCAASFDPGQTMLGDRQERWLGSRLRRNRARWTVLANQVMVTELDHDPGPGTVHWQDSWDGYPAARQRMLEALTTQRNPIIITGDWHSTFVNDIKFDYQSGGSPTVATEVITPAITSNGDGPVYGPYYGPMIAWNPHIKYFEGDLKGYVRCRADSRQLEMDVRFVDFVGSPGAGIRTAASFVVEDGQPGAQPA